MSWLTETLSSTLGRKLLMALTGLFLVSFLIVHLSGNFQLLMNDEGEAFNAYAKFMTTNPLIKAASYILYSGILLHVIYSIVLAIKNKSARPVKYARTSSSPKVSWNSRNMGLLGTIILIFLVIHLRNFWYEMHWGEIGVDMNGNRDLYSVVTAAFAQPLYVLLYIVSMVGLAFHLAHGFSSAFQTLGWNHPKYSPLISKLGLAISILIPIGFAIIPIFLFIKTLA
jgi:succinate dehydrogenase / fumarate reductase, cytochrome b subunit